MLVPWTTRRPLGELESWTNRMQGLLEGWPGGQEFLTATDWNPAVDIKENETAFQLKFELPEVGRDDVKVALDNGVLTVRGERKKEKEEKGEKYHRIERAYGSFMRTFTVPDNTDPEKVRARCHEGVLTVEIPKATSTGPQAREIKVG